jgi:hypothetical protein
LYGTYAIYWEDTSDFEEICDISYCRNDHSREAIFENGNVIKYKEGKYSSDVEEWIFSPSLEWNDMPEKIIEEIKGCNCIWDYYGKVVTDENYADPNVGWVNDFFIMKSDGQ